MRVLKAVVLIVLAYFLIDFVLVKFATVETRYECSGEITDGRHADEITVFLRYVKYRWRAEIVKDSQGAVYLEIPHVGYEVFPKVERIGDFLNISKDGERKGQFSTLSGVLNISFSATPADGGKDVALRFVGDCKATLS